MYAYQPRQSRVENALVHQDQEGVKEDNQLVGLEIEQQQRQGSDHIFGELVVRPNSLVRCVMQVCEGGKGMHDDRQQAKELLTLQQGDHPAHGANTLIIAQEGESMREDGLGVGLAESRQERERSEGLRGRARARGGKKGKSGLQEPGRRGPREGSQEGNVHLLVEDDLVEDRLAELLHVQWRAMERG